MKVLLINPPTGIYDRADRCQAPIEEEGIEMVRPPMDLAYMAAMVEKADQNVTTHIDYDPFPFLY